MPGRRTVADADADADASVTGVQLATRPSAFVVAVKLTWLVAAGRGLERSVRVTGRLAAGVPVKVFRTWQVIGSRDIFGGEFGLDGVFVEDVDETPAGRR